MSNLSKIRIKDANGVEKEHNIVDSRVGNLTELTTENKENLVNAINEAKGDIENKASKNLSNVTNEDFLNKCSVAGIPDASTKMDKDNPVGTGSLSIEGNGAFGGKVSVGANIIPTENNDLATKKYVDDNSTIKAVDCTRAEYDAMEYHDPDTYYNIIDEDNGLATHEMDGLMSAEDKIKLDNMSSGSDPKPVTITRTVIFEGNAYQLSNLSNPLSNFDFIEIAYKMRFGGMQVVSITPVESMLSEINGEKGYYLAPFLLSNNEMYFGDAYATKFTNNTLIYTSNSNTIRVVGIKLSI